MIESETKNKEGRKSVSEWAQGLTLQIEQTRN